MCAKNLKQDDVSVAISSKGVDIGLGYIQPCVQCGFCCSLGPCGYGEWDKEKHQCKFLGETNKEGQRACGKHKEILEFEKDNPFAMFGCGCSSSLFNNCREAVIQIRKQLNKENAYAKSG